ncbi:MAG TPA: LamG-like jellyroll fold domain-containing protein [Bacteroidota bacterium]
MHDTASGNDGIASGTTIIPGRFGNGRSFNGTSDYVSIPSSAAFDFDTSSFSIDLWFKTTQGSGVILRRGLAPDPGFMISLLNGHVVGMIGNRSDLPWPNALLSDTSVATYADNAWHSVTFTRSLSAGRLLLYVDGVMASQPGIGYFTLPLSGNHPLTIGRWENNDYPSYFAGAIDEIRISGSNIVRWPVRITVHPARLDFGGVRVTSRDTLGFQVTNAGYGDSLRISAITSSNSHFSVPGGPTALGPGAHRTFDVLYVPTGSHTDTGTVTIASNDPSNPLIHIVVTGQGYAISDTPSISSIAYIAYNQARIVWTRSAFDTVGAADPVTEYSVWHRVPGSGSGYQSKSPAANTSFPADTPGPTWEFIQSVPAIGLDAYSLAVQVPVTTSGASSWQVYMVVAQTRNLVTFMSPPDSIRGIAVTGIKGSEENPAPAKAAVSLVVFNTLGQAVAREG